MKADAVIIEHGVAQVLGQARLLALAPSAGSNLAQVLLECATEHGKADDDGVCVPFHMTREEIGRIIGSWRQTVSRLLSDFKRHRLIRVTDHN